MKRSTILLALLALCTPLVAQDTAVAERQSSFGVYAGYGEPVFDGHTRESFYITMRDGVDLACDLYRPTLDGEVSEDPLPLVWTHDRYHRAVQAGDRAIETKLLAYDWLNTMLRHGYLVAAVDVRGGGASFGTWTGIFNATESDDAYEIIEWFADQEWCDGNIGMYGGSYLGGTQFMAASRKPPHLKALFPFVAPTELYDVAWSGGIYRDDLCRIWGELTHGLDRSAAVAAVEFDDGYAMKTAALAEHEDNLPFEAAMRRLPFRTSELDGQPLWIDTSPLSHTDAIEESGVAVYHEGGWLDPFSRDAFLMYANLDLPQKMIMGPWFHTQSSGIDWNAEAMRWFDYWLKDIQNGVMDGPAIHYWTVGAPAGEEWRATDQWPLPHEERTAFYFNTGRSESIDSSNDGLLSTASTTPATETCVVDYKASSGALTRWSNAVGQGGRNPAYADQSVNDARCMTYTTPVLDEDVEVTGHPVAHLWVSVSGANDADFFVYLEEVTPDGRSEYVSEGCLRATHRKLAQAPRANLDLPYHSHLEADLLPVTAEPMELVFDLFPLSNIFDAGNRIRVTIAGADDENALTPEVEPAPEVGFHLGGETASRIVLPVIPAAKH